MLQKEDFDIIVSFAKLKSINPVIINVATISKQKFPNSRESSIHYGRGLAGYSKTMSVLADAKMYEVLSIL